MAGYKGNYQPKFSPRERFEQGRLEQAADALLAEADKVEDATIIEQAQTILRGMNITLKAPMVLEEAKDVVDSFGSLKRVESILYGRDEAKQAAEAVIAGNPLYSETFTPEKFLRLAVSYAVSQTYGLGIDITSVDELLAVRDLQEGKFGRAFLDKVRAKEQTELEELAEDGKLPLFSYMELAQKARKISTQ